MFKSNTNEKCMIRISSEAYRDEKEKRQIYTSNKSNSVEYAHAWQWLQKKQLNEHGCVAILEGKLRFYLIYTVNRQKRKSVPSNELGAGLRLN
jgi:hypothetical protein